MSRITVAEMHECSDDECFSDENPLTLLWRCDRCNTSTCDAPKNSVQ